MTSIPPKQGSSSHVDIVALQVSEVIAEVTGQKITNMEAELADEGFDSMAKLDLLAALEEHFSIVLKENVIKDFYSISRIARIIEDTIRVLKTEQRLGRAGKSGAESS